LKERRVRGDPQRQHGDLLQKLQGLSAEKLAEVEDFVDSLRQRQDDGGLTHSVTALSEDSFRRIWNNPDDADYDRL
jgi:hypothetical protein